MSCVAKRTRSQTKAQNVAKVMKLDSPDRTEIINTNIVDLNNDCLEEVFSYLSQSDLLHIYEADPRLRFASERTFARKYGHVPASVTNVGLHGVSVSKLKISARLLRAFGHLMSKLRIVFKLEKIEVLLESIEDNCGEKITELEFQDVAVLVREPTSTLYNIGLRKIISFLRRVNKSFPNLVDLKLDYRSITKYCPYFDILAVPLPSLRSFSMVGPLLPSTTIYAFIDQNPQLESFRLVGEPNAVNETPRSLFLTEDFLESLSESLPQLKSLYLNGVSLTDMSLLREYPNRFPNLKQLTFGCFASVPDPEIGYMSCLGEDVEDLELFTFSHSMSTVADSIARFKKLKRLILHLSVEDLRMEWLAALALQLNDVLVWSEDGIRGLMQQFGHLTEIVISRYNRFESYTRRK